MCIAVVHANLVRRDLGSSMQWFACGSTNNFDMHVGIVVTKK